MKKSCYGVFICFLFRNAFGVENNYHPESFFCFAGCICMLFCSSCLYDEWILLSVPYALQVALHHHLWCKVSLCIMKCFSVSRFCTLSWKFKILEQFIHTPMPQLEKIHTNLPQLLEPLKFSSPRTYNFCFIHETICADKTADKTHLNVFVTKRDGNFCLRWNSNFHECLNYLITQTKIEISRVSFRFAPKINSQSFLRIFHVSVSQGRFKNFIS